MAKKIIKTIQRIETAKVSELYKKESSSSIDDLKIKLAGVENIDHLSDLKNKLSTIEEEDPLAELKKSLLNISNFEEEKEVLIEEISEEIEEIEIEEEEEIQHVEFVEEEEPVENIETVEEILNVENTKHTSHSTVIYSYEYKETYSNNILTRTIRKTDFESIVVHISMTNLEYENYGRKTSTPFEIYHKGIKVLNFYEYKNSIDDTAFKKDIYILRNNLVIDSTSYPLEEIEIVNINL